MTHRVQFYINDIFWKFHNISDEDFRRGYTSHYVTVPPGDATRWPPIKSTSIQVKKLIFIQSKSNNIEFRVNDKDVYFDNGQPYLKSRSTK
jgi:hypothetical protein